MILITYAALQASQDASPMGSLVSVAWTCFLLYVLSTVLEYMLPLSTCAHCAATLQLIRAHIEFYNELRITINI